MPSTSISSEHTLIVSDGEINFELTYTSIDDPKDGIPVAQVVRAQMTYDNYLRHFNKDRSKMANLVISVK